MASPVRDDERKGARRRRDIVDAAIAVFAKQGYDGASIREIADVAGMNKGNLYYYFPAKDDLLFEIADDLHNEFNRQFQRWSMGHDQPLQRLRSVFQGHAVLVCQSQQQTRITYENWRFLTEARRAVVIEKRDLYERSMAKLIGEYVAASQPADVTHDLGLETRSILGMLNWIYEWYSPTGRTSQSEVASRLAEMALRSLGPLPTA
jgi:TetR/AcrR family transcriptional regulator, cholesterol catabolism regulator